MKSINKLYRETLSRKASGSITELGPAVIVTLPILIAILEMAMIVNAVCVNDATANEATRAVSAGDPINGKERAQAIVNEANKHSHAMNSKFRLVSVKFTPANILKEENKMIPFGGSLSGSVTVRTEVTLQQFAAAPRLVFDSEKTSPFTYNVPNTAGGIAPAP